MPRWRKVWIEEYRGKRDTTYRVCCYDSQVGARRIVRSFKTKHLAKAFTLELEAYLNGEGPKPGTPASTRGSKDQPRLWSHATAQWIDSGATREKTRHDYRLVLNQFAKQMKIVCVEDVTEDTISNFLSSLKQKGRSLATCATYLRTIAAFLRSALPGNSPISKKLIKQWTPYKQRKRARPHYFTEVEYNKLIRAAGTVKQTRKEQRNKLWWKAFIAVLYHGGLRLGEAAHLIWQDIDFKRGVIFIQPHVGLPDVFEWRPKGKARKTVPVPRKVMTLLKQIQRKQPDGVPYVFLTNGRYLELKNKQGRSNTLLYSLDADFRSLRETANIPEGTIHDMRRTCITNWAKHPQLTPKDVQILAGHQDLNTTLDIYTMVDEQDVVDKMLNLINN